MTDERWGGYDMNPYYNPEKCGLQLVATLEMDEPYEFDIVALFKAEADGRLYAAQDSGCSCPTPFENVHGIGDLTPVRTLDDLKGVIGQSYADGSDYRSWPLGQKDEFLKKARAALASTPQ